MGETPQKKSTELDKIVNPTSILSLIPDKPTLLDGVNYILAITLELFLTKYNVEGTVFNAILRPTRNKTKSI
jgi:hypothetical protein